MSDRDMDSILEVLRLTQELLALADRADTEEEDDSCRILFGVVRDCAFKIHSEAEREVQRHSAKKLQAERKESM